MESEKTKQMNKTKIGSQKQRPSRRVEGGGMSEQVKGNKNNNGVISLHGDR